MSREGKIKMKRSHSSGASARFHEVHSDRWWWVKSQAEFLWAEWQVFQLKGLAGESLVIIMYYCGTISNQILLHVAKRSLSWKLVITAWKLLCQSFLWLPGWSQSRVYSVMPSDFPVLLRQSVNRSWITWRSQEERGRTNEGPRGDYLYSSLVSWLKF